MFVNIGASFNDNCKEWDGLMGSKVTVSEVQPGFAAFVTGVDLTQPLISEDAMAIETAIDRFGVLVFRDQAINDDQQLVFARAFSLIEDKRGGHIVAAKDERLDAAINDISNLDKNNNVLSRDNRQRLFNLGNQLWHSDSSFRAFPAKYSMLSGRQVPVNGGGNTEFADMCAAFDELDPDLSREAESLVCEHSLIYSREKLGFEPTQEEKKMFEPVRQRLVREHASTGRKSLYLSAHAGSIVGWPVPEARIYLLDLMEHAVQRKFVYSHIWGNNDLIMWDNRCTMHRARRFDETQVRDMRRTTVAGDEMTAEQAA